MDDEEAAHLRITHRVNACNQPSNLSAPTPQLKALSVKALTNPLVFDNLNNPVPGGLYDLALGPYETGQTCGTCGLGFLSCPGHFGHVPLEVPVYHPLVFGCVLGVAILRHRGMAALYPAAALGVCTGMVGVPAL